MPRTRNPLTALRKLLSAVAQPVYVLDGEGRLVYANEACGQLLGVDAEDLVGQDCRYHSRSDPAAPASQATYLAPPPEVFAGQRLTIAAEVPGGPSGAQPLELVFVPLHDDEEQVTCVLAVAQPPSSATAAHGPADESAELHQALQRFRTQLAGRYHLDRLAGESLAIRRVRRQAILASQSTASVAIVGPPGSGRQHVARAIHYGDRPHSSGALVPVDCEIVTMESLADTIRSLTMGGPLRRTASTGSLLLLDVEKLDFDAQTEMAALLEHPDLPLRMMSTAQAPLADLAEAGRLRPDLACMLSTLEIQVPPLRERLEDLPLLAQLFLEDANATAAQQRSGFSADALELLLAYPWNGHVEELAELVKQAHADAVGPVIQPTDLPQRVRFAIEAAVYPPKETETIELEPFLEKIERELIERALAQAKGNKSQAAKMLGLTRPKFYRRLEQLGLDEA